MVDGLAALIEYEIVLDHIPADEIVVEVNARAGTIEDYVATQRRKRRLCLEEEAALFLPDTKLASEVASDRRAA